MPRRRKTDTTGGILLILAIALGYFLYAVVRSNYGYAIAAVVVISGLVLGAWAAKDESTRRQRWRDRENLRALSGTEFERHVAELYRRMGYTVALTKASGDQGVDVIATSGAERLGIQCKQYAGSVGNDAVQQAYAGARFYNCTKAVVICTAGFTNSAKALAQRTDVALVDGATYVGMMERVAPSERPERVTMLSSGRALAFEIGGVAAAVFIVWLHGVAWPVDTSETNQQYVQPPNAAYVPSPLPAVTFTPTSAPIPKPQASLMRAAAPTPKPRRTPSHPPWWTPPPSPAPSTATIAPTPMVTTSTAATPTETLVPTVDQGTSNAPQATPAASSSPEAVPPTSRVKITAATQRLP
jgi:HJR/Mrr/RecB family endonuclease